MANGHPDAYTYPLWYVWEEADLIHKRTNAALVSTAVLTQAAIVSVLDGKNGGKAFNKLIKSLQK